ncbi:MAG: glycosyltransferase family 2 protein, partial [Clostridia bacterium]|nr:glycosyltransferase family 2 protein [Clostridia bacterium]
QTYRDFQLILVDDGSPDSCPRLCDDYAKRDPRVHVIHRENGGLSAARNSGIEWVFDRSPTKWITFIDSDDWIHPQFLELLVGAAEENDAVTVAGFCVTSELPRSFETYAREYDVLSPDDFFIDNSLHPVSACGRLFKTSSFSKLRFPEGKIHEDRFTTYKIIFQCEKVIYIDQPLYYCFENGDSITRTEWTPKRLDDIEAMEQQIQFFKMSPHRKVCYHLLSEYLMLLIYSLKKASKSRFFRKHRVMLKIKLKRFLLTDGKKINITAEQKNDIFKYLYPTLFRIKRKLSRCFFERFN